jgi:hypothetical protein
MSIKYGIVFGKNDPPILYYPSPPPCGWRLNRLGEEDIISVSKESQIKLLLAIFSASPGIFLGARCGKTVLCGRGNKIVYTYGEKTEKAFFFRVSAYRSRSSH